MLSKKPVLVMDKFFLFAKTAEQGAAPHFHKYAEIIFSGENCLEVHLGAREVQRLDPHEMLIIPPEQVCEIININSHQQYQLLHINLDKLFLLFSPCPYADYISLMFSGAISKVIYRGDVVKEIYTIYNNIKNEFEIKYIGDIINIINIIKIHTPENIINSGNDVRKLKFYAMLSELVESEPMDSLHLDNLAKKFFMSKSTFQRQVKKCTGLSFHAWLQKSKMQKALVDLRKNIPISEIALNLGFSSASHFCKTFKSYYGVTPRESRNGDQPIGFIK